MKSILSRLREKWDNRTHIPMRRVKGLIALWSVIVAVSAYEVHNNMVEQYCNREFRTSLIERAAANDKAESAADAQLDAIIGWIEGFVATNQLPYGPERQAQAQITARAALQKFYDERKRRDEALEEKHAHTIQELRCGK